MRTQKSEMIIHFYILYYAPPMMMGGGESLNFSVNYLSHDELAHSISNPSISRNRGNNNASYDSILTLAELAKPNRLTKDV